MISEQHPKTLDVLWTSAVFVLADIEVHNFSRASKGNLRIDQCGHGDDVIALKVAAHDKTLAVLSTAALNRPSVTDGCLSVFVYQGNLRNASLAEVACAVDKPAGRLHSSATLHV